MERIAVYGSTDYRGPVPAPGSHLAFNRQYRDNVNRIKTVLHDLAAGRKLEVAQMETVFDSAFTQVKDNYRPMETINEMKKADEYTYTHGLNISLYGGLIARWMGLSENEIKNVIQAGVLHDIGKAKIPPQILNKKGPLLPEEREQVKKHAALGYNLVHVHQAFVKT